MFFSKTKLCCPSVKVSQSVNIISSQLTNRSRIICLHPASIFAQHSLRLFYYLSRDDHRFLILLSVRPLSKVRAIFYHLLPPKCFRNLPIAFILGDRPRLEMGTGTPHNSNWGNPRRAPSGTA